MTKLIFCVAIFSAVLSERSPDVPNAVVIGAHAQNAQQPTDQVTFYLRNDKGRFRNVNFVIYRPGEADPQVESSMLLPWQRFKFTLPIGSKVYVASKAHLQQVNAGHDLRAGAPPDLTVRRDDEEQVYAIKK